MCIRDSSLASGLKVTEDSRGTILFFHGGGWVNGTVDFYLDACTTMALRLERRVVAVDYRRAPEHRFPQAPEDCYEVARQLYAGTLLDDVDADHVVLFGDSAGGNLAAVVSLMARDRGEFAPRTQMLLYPATYNDHDPATSLCESVRENGEDLSLIHIFTATNVAGSTAAHAANVKKAQAISHHRPQAMCTNLRVASASAPRRESRPETASTPTTVSYTHLG